jgi:type I restriction enzyme R subunit
MTDIHKEKAFEDHIEAHLVEHGWLRGRDADFDPTHAVDPTHLFAFLRDTQPATWDRLQKQHGAALGKRIVEDLTKLADTTPGGILELLRHGLSFRGVTLKLAYFAPAYGKNPDLVAKHAQNRLVVYRQVRFQPDRDARDQPESVDLMLALNGLPIATVELKNHATGQSVRDAILQYERRDPRAPLFRFKRGALVHFAVDPNEVYMTTRLNREGTVFLPFNQGHEGGAGNPPSPVGHRTAYLWERVWARDSFLDIVGRFLHLEKDLDAEDPKTARETLVFPRYHQLDAVRALVAAAKHDGAGTNYLVQHSAGSGKSNTIAWLAHRLHSLYREEEGPDGRPIEKKVFDSVVVVTDRQVLDRQLQQTIWQIDHTPGIVQRVDKHSRQLGQALRDGGAIIITTLQKFPFVHADAAQFPARRYAIIADEAHSSQAGETARAMKEVLGAGPAEPEGVHDVMMQDYGLSADDEDAEDVLTRVVESRQQQKNLSFFAFTATPKGKTLNLFGIPGEDGRPRPFHLYSMRQAIEEGFILDVLESYTTYGTFLRLLKTVDEDPELDESQAKKALGRFIGTHALVIGQKVEIIVEHFRTSVAHKIGGRAKAMIVTGSREAAVRYFRAFQRYTQQKGYQEDLQAYVAFSGTVVLDGQPGDSGEKVTEPELNGISEAALKKAFRQSAVHRFLIVADKYQTGYDEPLLHTMYVDKRLADIAAVQTLSRLNRRTAGKEDTFVLDFVNDADEIQRSFQPYYQATTALEGADHTHLYRLRSELLDAQVVHASDVEAFANDFYVPKKKRSKKDHGKWQRWIQPAVDRFGLLGPEERERFRGKLRAYVNLYAYLSQVMGFPAPDLEKLYAYGRFLLAELPQDERETIDLKGKVDLDTLVLDVRTSGAIELVKGEEGEVRSPTATDPRPPTITRSALSELIEKINERIASRYGAAPVHLIEGVITELTDDDTVVSRALANAPADFQIASDVRSSVDRMMVSHLDENGDFVTAYLNDEEGIKTLVLETILREVYKRIRERDAAERGIDPVLLADVGKLRNRLEPKLRQYIKRSLKMQRGDAWIRELLAIFPAERRKQCEGVDADTILRERTYLLDLITFLHTRWTEFFTAFESGPPKTRLTRDQVKVLLDYVNTHREDAHAGALDEAELATLKIAVTALERAIDRLLEE